MGTEGFDVDVSEAGLEDGDGQVVLVDVRQCRCQDIKSLKTCLAAVVA